MNSWRDIEDRAKGERRVGHKVHEISLQLFNIANNYFICLLSLYFFTTRIHNMQCDDNLVEGIGRFGDSWRDTEDRAKGEHQVHVQIGEIFFRVSYKRKTRLEVTVFTP